MNRAMILFSIPLCLLLSCQQTKTQQQSTATTVQKKGPIVDKIYANVKMKEEFGIKDVADGLSDVFHWGVNGATINGLSKELKSKLDIYCVPAGSWSLFFNPIPNKAPYLVSVSGKKFFNPMALREVRFAMNYLINRKYIVEEIVDGAGGSMFTMASPNQPGTSKYNLIAAKMGLTPEGNEEKAINDITTALNNASRLPELKGKLVKQGTWWMYDNKPVTIKFLIRVDDPQGRLKEGEYVALQIEKVGIKVERLLWDRSKCGKAVYGGNPADYEWNIYTEAWGAGATRAYWDQILCQMYAPWFGNMPGSQDKKKWNYEHKELDSITKKAYTGNVFDENEYWKLTLRAQKLGLEEAVRLYVCYQNNFFVANKERFKNRMVYGLADGLDSRWSYVTANTKDNILRVTAFSAKGALFMFPWDPVGTDGFSDSYSQGFANPMSEPSMFESPATAQDLPCRTIPQDISTEITRNKEGDVIGNLPIPENAILYNSALKKWVNVKPGSVCMSKVTYLLKLSNYHHGRPMAVSDFLFADAFTEEWTNKDGDQDRFYDASYESSHKPLRKTVRGFVVHNDSMITSYFDYNFPPSKGRVAGWGAPTTQLIVGRQVNVSWEIVEACALMVAEGSKSGAKYSFTFGEAAEPDLLSGSSVEDIKAKLIEMKEKKYIPSSIKDYMKETDVLATYDSAISWILKHGHAFISNGPFYLEKYDPSSNYLELNAFRDPTYPFSSDYWPKQFETKSIRIDDVEIPSILAKNAQTSTPLTMYVSELSYPEDKAVAAEDAKVSITFLGPDTEKTIEAIKKEAGKFVAELDSATVSLLPVGMYTILVSAEKSGAMQASMTVTASIK